MAGTLKTNAIQLGDSATDSQNFQLRTNVNGTATLARGAAGNLGDILTVDATGKVTLPNTVVAGTGPCFSAYQSVAQFLGTTYAVIQFQSKEFDPTGAFDNTTNYRFQPTVAGYYSLIGGIASVGGVHALICGIWKNGASYKTGTFTGVASPGPLAVVSGLVFLNGSTDYVDLRGFHPIGVAANLSIAPAGSNVYFQGFLARAA